MWNPLKRKEPSPSSSSSAGAATPSMPLDRQVKALEAVVRRVLERHYGAFPLPPEELRMHVGTNVAPANTWHQGISSSTKVIEIFGESPAGPILDWGCGSGRTLTWLQAYPGWRENYVGCDLDAAAIEWLRSIGPFDVSVCEPDPPLPFEAGRFAGVFAFSVLTHIHPTKHRDWYAELHRVLRPGGTAFLTTQGDAVLANPLLNFKPRERAAYAADGSLYVEHEGYCKDAALVSEAFTRKALAGLFEVLDYKSPGYHAMDGFLVRRSDAR